jgi:hypothetical protein
VSILFKQLEYQLILLLAMTGINLTKHQRAYSLHFDASWSLRRIIIAVGYNKSTVYRVVNGRVTPHRGARKSPLLATLERCQLVNFIRADPTHRRLS